MSTADIRERRESPDRRPRLPSWRRVWAIAATGIRVRMARSLITLGGIGLALAYLLTVRIGGLVAERVAMLSQSVKCYDSNGRFLGATAGFAADLNVRREQIDRWRAALVRKADEEILRQRHQEARAQRLRPPTIEQLASGAWPDETDPGRRAERAAEFAAERERVVRQLAEQLERKLEQEGLTADLTVVGALRQQRAGNAWIVGIVLVVAMAGVTNAVLMSVTERFREIGTMKCLGAMDRLVLMLFLFEMAVFGIAGALLGTLGGVLLSVAQLGMRYGWAAAVDVPWSDAIRMVGETMAMGIALTVVGGIAPAGTAARMAPVEAMRVDQ